MSVWKKAAKANQKTHRERHQPFERKHLGLLEKKKDYVLRAKDYNEKKQTIKVLKKRALNKNPDEFYHHMINSKIEDGMHFEKEQEPEDTPEQLQLMQTQDLKYIVSKRTQERRKIEKLQSQLHLISVDGKKKSKHIYFEKSPVKKTKAERQSALSIDQLSAMKIPDISREVLEASTRKRQALYSELGKRIQREKELSVVQSKLEMARFLQNKTSVLPPKKVKKGSKDKAPVYVWKYERKK